MYIYLFFIIIGFLVLISTLVMTFSFRANKILNFYLIFITLILCFYLIVHGLNKFVLIGLHLEIWNFNYFQIIIFLIPFVYLFFEKLILNLKYPDKKDTPYFIIPAPVGFYMGSVYFQHLFINKVVIFVLSSIFILFFYWKIHRLLKPFLWNKYYEVDTLDPIVKNWANFIFTMMVIVLVHFFIFLITSFFDTGRIFQLIQEAGLLVVFLIGYFKVILSPSLLYGNVKLQQITNVTPVFFVNKVWELDSNPRIINLRDLKVYNRILDKIPTYVQGIERIALVNYSFRKLDYSINDLSLELGLPKYYLEFIFKYYCKVSFNDYKKTVRIFDAVTLINQGYLSSNTLETLSRHVGFASYNPFLINFKEVVGVPPFDYYKKKM